MNPPRPIIASRRTFLATAGLASAYLAASPVKTLAAAPARRRFSVSLLSASPEVFDLISWRLWDPLVLAVGIPDIRAQAARECDLLLVTDRLGEHRQAAKAQPAGAYEEGTRGVTGTSLADVLTALPGARGVIAVQPAALGEPLSEAVAKRCGVAFKQWHPETPSSSHLTDHPLNALLRSLGRRPDHAHVTFDWHPEVTAPPASVVTRLASGAPDIVLQGRACFIASNLFSDLAAYGRHPDYWSHEATLAALLANLVRTALGETPATVSNRQAYDEARMAFYGYAFARKFVTDLQALKQNSQSPEGPLAAADDLVARAADRLLAGDVAAMRGGLREAGEHLIAIRQSLTPVKPYFVRGWHGGLLTNRKVGSEIVGYAEWGWPSFSMRWAEDRLRAAETQKTPTVNQVCGQTWDVIASFGLTELNRWKKASAAGLVETVKGMYSDAYLEVLGTESNLRQFEYGIKALALMGGESHTFALAYDDFALHPQLPQILRGYGFKRAVLRCGNPGVVVGVDKETLLWRGLDGALIPAVPKYRSVPVAIIGSGPTGGPNGGVNTMARTLVAAEKAGFRTVLAGGIQDHTMNMHGEYEWEAFNAMAHVQASPVTFAGYFAAVPPPNEARYFTADEMVGRPWAWCGFGSLNQMAREDRQLERLLVNAEKFATLASASGRPYPADLFEQAWKNLLSSQDHFVYGCGGAQNPEGYHVGGLEEPFMPDYPGPRTPISTEASGRAWKTQVEDVAREELDGALHHLLIREARPTATAETQVVVYNPHNWDRTGEVQCWLHGLAAPGLAVTDGEREWPATVLERHQDAGGERLLLSFQASAPSLGYRAYAIQPRAATAAPPARPADAPPVLENRYLRAVFDSQTGGLTSLVEKSGGVELLRQGEQACFLCTYPPVDTAKATARIEWERADPVASSLRISGQLGRSSYQLRVLLAHDSPVLELQLDIDYGRGAIFGYKGQPGTLLRYVLPFAAGAVRRLNLPFGVYESKTDSPVALDFAELAYTDHGVALLNDGVPGLHFAQDDVAILISDGFPPLRGVHHYRFGLLPHRGDWR
ncbi:MAG: hypothetical protein FJ399_10505, partial [Verrucomicrobia bacterium]|nr:hypothetical protein [Verrucomicrobiota bacterium]